MLALLKLVHTTAVQTLFSHRVRHAARTAALVLLGLLALAIPVEAGRVTLAWDASTDPSVTGYTLFYGTAANTYTQSVEAGSSTTFTVQSLTNGVRYYFVVKSHTGSGVLSLASNEVNALPTNQPPSILNPGNVTMRTGALTLPISASDPDFDVLTFSATGLPAGLSIDTASGTISGLVPVGTHSVTVTVRDGVLTASTSFTITATPNAAPTLAAVATQNNDTNDVVSLQLVASDTDLDLLTFSATGLPAGLTLNSSTGRITGTPANGTGGANAVTVTVSDGSLSASRSFTWNVTDLNPGLVAAYGFEEASGTNVTDSTGGGLTGTISGATRITTGRFGKALSFDGVNDWVTVNDAARLDLSTALTLEAWVYPTAFTGWETVIIKETTDRLAYSLYAHSEFGVPAGQISNDGAEEQSATGTVAVPLNTWTHLATTYDGATVRLFVNGVQVGTFSATGPIVASTGPLRFGGNAPFGGFFEGRIDEVRIFNVALL